MNTASVLRIGKLAKENLQLREQLGGKRVTKAYQEICRNLSALEAFPKQWVCEVGDRIRIPVRPNMSAWAFLWHSAGLNTKQIRKLIGKMRGNHIPGWRIEEMITNEKHRRGVHSETLAYWREKWRQYKGRRKWREVKLKE